MYACWSNMGLRPINIKNQKCYSFIPSLFSLLFAAKVCKKKLSHLHPFMSALNIRFIYIKHCEAVLRLQHHTNVTHTI